jgi:hypothetical protein
MDMTRVANSAFCQLSLPRLTALIVSDTDPQQSRSTGTAAVERGAFAGSCMIH